MTSATMKAKIVRVSVEEGKTGLFYATSPDLKGLLVAEATIQALEEAIPKAVTDLYLACGVKVVVSRTDDADDANAPWVAFPFDLAKHLSRADA